MIDPESEDYRRGANDALVAEHTRHLAKINGSIDRFAETVHELDASIRGLQGLFQAAELTRIATAAALKEQTDARRDQSSDSWAPWSRIITIASALIAAAAVAVAIYTHR